jgi:redox-sensitive bicupin YhaK (pirin superfamily)
MITLRNSKERGFADHGWLKSQHTFSFAGYHDPHHMGFSVLRVINEDRILGGKGFDPHSHQDMEIISYVVEGAVEHQDSMGNKTVIKPGEIQRMCAGTGVRHSEYNHFKDKETHFLQIWILPSQKNLKPSYGQKNFSSELKNENLLLVISKHGRKGSLEIHQDVEIYLGKLKKDRSTLLPLSPTRQGWLQLISGVLKVKDVTVQAGDGLAITKEGPFEVLATEASHFIFFDLP